MAKGKSKEPVLPPGPECEACGGRECGTPRVPVCCENCTH
jgi:hypothetical protein